MTTFEDKPLAVDDPAVYHIQLQGALDHSWQEMLGDLQIEVRREASGAMVTILTGPVADQAALAGILNLVYDLGMPLLSVTRVG